MSTGKERVTLKDIAEKCGYSVNTVSRALRGDTRLPADTLQRIRQAADETGYVRNSLASSLRSGKSNMVAIIIEELKNQHYSYLVNQLGLFLNQHGYGIMILSTALEEDSEKQIARYALSHSVDGVIFFPNSNSQASARLLEKNHIPMVLVDREIDNFQADIVRPDDYQGGYLAGEILAKQGHREICYLAGPLKNGSQPLRQSGFLAALSHYGISREQIRIISHRQTFAAIRFATLKELLLPVDYTAIFSFNDEIAYYAMICLQENGVRIPGNISIIGFDNIRRHFPYLPLLSTIGEEKNAGMASIAVRLLLERMKNPGLPPRQEILPVVFYDGGTVFPST